MKHASLMLLTSLTLAACASQQVAKSDATSGKSVAVTTGKSTPRNPTSDFLPTLKDGQPWRADDPALKSGDLTVWKLQEMAQGRKFDELNAMFDHALTMDNLPVGYAAGRGARVLDIGGSLGKFLVAFTGASWHGKIFFHSNDPAASHGLNRIRQTLGDADSPIAPMAAFTTTMVTKHELTPSATSNLVLLNYAHPISDSKSPTLQERLLQIIQVYDVMVAVPGKYGPVYIGKTWLGHYDGSDQFHAFTPGTLIAWYFLDFNQQALDEQWKKEEIMVTP